ncbi:unnamed protein product [Allacma fusca]|uniref:Uncharacterized protein n=1 Tax=Allacma fusca TaxID=39272 RepID=A0A8J2L7Q1_9HEXA|nr:unnamed protein product [Allacma fusca]
MVYGRGLFRDISINFSLLLHGLLAMGFIEYLALNAVAVPAKTAIVVAGGFITPVAKAVIGTVGLTKIGAAAGTLATGAPVQTIAMGGSTALGIMNPVSVTVAGGYLAYWAYRRFG